MKVLAIGIDGLDSELLSRFENHLPNFKKLRENSLNTKMESVFPPDSPSAWSSIYTGKNPAEHGIVSFKDPFKASKYGEYLGEDVSGKTFWDKAGELGKKVCIVFPHLGYPVWPVNGVMVGRTTEVDIKEFNIQIYPASLSKKYDLNGLKPMTSYPLKLGDIIEPAKKVILNEVELASQLCQDVDWDLFFYYSSALDNIEHLFWMYYDKNDSYYYEGNPYENVILDFYKFYDEYVIGKFLKLLDSNTTFIVLSDHGHAMRPTNIVNVNEILRNNGYLQSKTGEQNKNINRYYVVDFIKKTTVSSIDKYRVIGKMASKFLSLFPNSMSLFTKTTPINFNETSAYLSDPSGGIKAYSYAGIRINKAVVNESYYECIRDEIIKIILSIKDPSGSESLVEWARRREEVYKGENIDKYPDILFKLKDDWGVGWEVNEGYYSKSRSHKLHSGNHRGDTAVFLTYSSEKLNLNLKKEMRLMDISPTILNLLSMDD